MVVDLSNFSIPTFVTPAENHRKQKAPSHFEVDRCCRWVPAEWTPQGAGLSDYFTVTVVAKISATTVTEISTFLCVVFVGVIEGQLMHIVRI